MAKKRVSEGVRKFYYVKEDVAWASGGAVARFLNGGHVSIVKQKIMDATQVLIVSLIPMGGDNVFLFYSWKDDILSVINGAAEFFNMFFLEVRSWSQNEDIEYERGAWLMLYGVPLHAWNIQFLNLCSSLFGRLIKVDLCTTKFKRLDFACILLIITTSKLLMCVLKMMSHMLLQVTPIQIMNP